MKWTRWIFYLGLLWIVSFGHGEELRKQILEGGPEQMYMTDAADSSRMSEFTQKCVENGGEFDIHIGAGMSALQVRLDSAPVWDLGALWSRVTVRLNDQERQGVLLREKLWLTEHHFSMLLYSSLVGPVSELTMDQLWLRHALTFSRDAGKSTEAIVVKVKCERSFNVWAFVLLALGLAMVGVAGELVRYSASGMIVGALPGVIIGLFLPLLYQLNPELMSFLIVLVCVVFTWLVMMLQWYHSKILLIYLGISGLLGGFWFGREENRTVSDWVVALMGLVVLQYASPFLWVNILLTTLALCVRMFLHLRIPHRVGWAFYCMYLSALPSTSRQLPKGLLGRLGWAGYLMYRSVWPETRRMLTMEEYREQTALATEEAMVDLRNTYNRAPYQWRHQMNFSEDTLGRIYRFMRTGDYLQDDLGVIAHLPDENRNSRK